MLKFMSNCPTLVIIYLYGEKNPNSSVNLKYLPPSIIEHPIIPLSPNSARRLLRRKNPHLVRFLKVIVKQRLKH